MLAHDARAARAARAPVGMHCAHAARRHGHEGGGVRAHAERGVEAAQQVVRLEDESHRARDVGEHAGDLGQVGARLLLDERVL